ncbi:MAG TPA: transposase [Chthonomonadaceae bacterium]|nr:transposase [Chthonomonadaceae bacterium]
MLQQAAQVIPTERPVIFLGNGEFNGVDLRDQIARLGWHFVCRVPKNTVFADAADWYSLSRFPLQPGDRFELEDVFYTERGFGPLLLVAVWPEGQKEPLCLVSNLEFLDEALLWYKRRFTIETLFSDQKSRGFHLGHSHLGDPQRLERLLLACCLASLWMVCLGACVVLNGGKACIHRSDRCDLSLFQIGLLWIEYCLNEGLPVPVPLWIRRFCPDRKSVR